MALYESDHTKFIREMMAKNPDWADDQRVGRALWWDKKIDLNEQGKFKQSQEPNKSYPYDVHFDF